MHYCFLGDSITEGVGSTKRYTDFIAESQGAQIHNFGVNGANTQDMLGQIARLKEQVGHDFDVLFIWIGTNDFNGSVPLGSWYRESREELPTGFDEAGKILGRQVRIKRSFDMDETTFRGRLNTALYEIRKSYGDKRIVLMTPIHRGFAFFGGENYQPEELYANRIGLFLDSYIQAVREAADIWSCELIDLYRESGLFPMEEQNARLYFHDVQNDRLHPNCEGHRRIAQTILRHL